MDFTCDMVLEDTCCLVSFGFWDRRIVATCFTGDFISTTLSSPLPLLSSLMLSSGLFFGVLLRRDDRSGVLGSFNVNPTVTSRAIANAWLTLPPLCN